MGIADNSMEEKRLIEEATAKAFLNLYNSEMGTSYAIIAHLDAPDICCRDLRGNKLNIEITLTEDRPGDIQAVLGRSNSRSLDAFKKHLSDVKDGEASHFDRVSCLGEGPFETIVSGIKKKCQNSYGNNTALVVRDTSPIDWGWSGVIDRIMADVDRNPFDKGIWIINDQKDKIYKISGSGG